jgi:hypothetical protein
MDVRYPRCAGLDVHQKTVVACTRIAAETGPVHLQRVFGTTTRDLLALADWLAAQGCTMWPWRPLACTGSPSGTRSRASVNSSWPMRCMSGTSLGERRRQ